MEPEIIAKNGGKGKIPVFDFADESNSMLFPIHQACLGIIERMCQARLQRQQHEDPDSKMPKTLEDFCNGLQQQRSRNLKARNVPGCDYYYANSGGIEWPHDYYGARQMWSDPWDTEPGWEVYRHGNPLVLIENIR